MAFKSLERTTLQLSLIALSSMYVSTVNAQNADVAAKPATAEACVALESNAERLSCYDALFKVQPAEKEMLVSERQAAQEIKPEPTEKLTLNKKSVMRLRTVYLL